VGYLKNPDEIYRESFSAIRRETDLTRMPEDLHSIAIRMVHTRGMPDLVDDLAWHGDVLSAARTALQNGRPVIVDATMVAAGIMSARLPQDNRVICTLNDERTPGLAQDLDTTRSAAAVDLWTADLDGAIIAIGNAPTALFRLLEVLNEPDTPKPETILAFPVGFVGAAESKQALIDADLGIPFVTVSGRRGGSALAAAAVNACLLPDSSLGIGS